MEEVIAELSFLWVPLLALGYVAVVRAAVARLVVPAMDSTVAIMLTHDVGAYVRLCARVLGCMLFLGIVGWVVWGVIRTAPLIFGVFPIWLYILAFFGLFAALRRLQTIST